LPHEPTPCTPAQTFRLYADRAAGGDRHHRHLDRPALAGRAKSARRGRSRPVAEQPQANGPGRQQHRRHLQHGDTALLWYFPSNSATGVQGSLFYHMLPYIEQQNVYNNGGFSVTGTYATIKTYIAPADPSNSISGGSSG